MYAKKYFKHIASFCMAIALFFGALCIFTIPSAAAEDRIATAAELIAEKVDAYAEEISLSTYNLTPAELSDAVEMVVYEHHELFFLSQSWSYYKNSSTGKVTKMVPEYRYDVADIPEKREEYVDLFNSFVSSCNIISSDSDYERVLAVHDNMCASFCYDTTLEIDCTYELLVQGKGVCEALAILYEAVLTHLGIECDTVINRAEAHCWNVVKLDGEWYHLDVTWADPLTYGGGINNHDYFLLNDTELAALNATDGGHSSWYPAISATGTKYQNASLSEHTVSVLQYGNIWYSLDISEGNIGIYDISDFTYETIYNIGETWTNLEKPGYCWTNALTGFALRNSRLYFNTPTEIMSIGIENRDVRTELAPTLNGTNIYGFDMILGNITYYHGTSPNKQQTGVTVPIPTHPPVEPPRHFVMSDTTTAILDEDSAVISFNAVTSVANIKSLFPNESITVTDKNGNTLTSGKISTGCVVTSMIDGTSASITVAVIGDVNGDGAIDSADTLAISAGLVSGLNVSAANAADVNRDGAATTADFLYAVAILKY